MENRVLNVEFVVEDDEKVASRVISMKTSEDINKLVAEQVYTQFIGKLAVVGGLPLTFEEADKKLEALEVKIRTGCALPSKRPGGKRSKGTGFTLHPTIKSYKSTIKNAYKFGVELLDAVGNPIGINSVRETLKEAMKVEKDPEEKLMGAVELVINLRDNCPDDSDPRVVDAENHLFNWLRAKGYTVIAPEVEMAEAA